MIDKFKRTGRSALMALVLGATAVTGSAFTAASPVQAQPSIGFSFNFGPGEFFFGTERGRRIYCMSNSQVRRLVRSWGYDDVRVRSSNSNTVRLTAELGRRDYRLVVNRCSGRIVDRDRI
jgi:hypothetical protein